MSETYKVFTYGTLRKGHHNHDLMKGSEFLGDYETGPGYTKYIKGLSYLIEDGSGPGCTGELYQVTPLTLKLLDRLEGHPDFYCRKEIDVYSVGKDLGIKAWCYIMKKENV